MAERKQRLLHFIAASLAFGVALLVIVEIWRPPEVPPWQATLHHLLREVGFAFVVGSVVATIFERFLSDERERHLKGLMREYQEMEDFGFRKIFPDRQNVFDELIRTSLKEASHVRIIGICISIFREFNRQYKRPSLESPVEYFASQILHGQRIQVLMLKRNPTQDELKFYGVEAGDFYHMREWDEDKLESFNGGRRLRKIANQAVGQWIEVLICIADRATNASPEDRREALNRLQLKEYIALPSVSLYILDEEIFVTPYLYKRHCSSVPAFVVGGRSSPLYRDYLAHFTETWNSTLTTPTVPHQFVESLILDPRETVAKYRSRCDQIRKEDQAKCKSDPDYLTSPDYFRSEERAMRSLLNDRAESGADDG